VFRTVFVLRVLERISGIETAASLGVHETTVRTRLYRAHRRLDAELVRRIRSAPALVDLPAARLERLVGAVLLHLPRGAALNAPAATP
jgi:sigma-70-like protein